MPQRILILSRTPIGEKMSSPGIRYVNLARVLREALPDAEVTLAVPDEYSDNGKATFSVVYYDPNTVLKMAKDYDVLIGMSFPLSLVLPSPLLRKQIFVLDFFSQFHIEWMEVGRDLYKGLHRRFWSRVSQLYANLQLQLADFVLCANERQRDSYIGAMASIGLLTPRVYDKDPTLRQLIDVAPHGIRPEPPPERRGRIKGVFPGIEKDDKLLLWLGGILYWYDPVTVIRALARVREKHPEAKLLFVGSNYPGIADLGKGVRFRQAIAEAKRLGLWQEGVFLQQEWVPHEEVVDYLMDADIAVTTYFTNAETRYAHRTRFLDFIWAQVPLICTEGDVLAEEVSERGWGIAVPERDEDALVAALTRLLEDEEFARDCRTNLEAARKEVSWEAAFEPLLRFLSTPGGPRPVADKRSIRALPVWRSALFYIAGRLVERALALTTYRKGEDARALK